MLVVLYFQEGASARTRILFFFFLTHTNSCPGKKKKKKFYNVRFKDEAELLEHVPLFITNAFEHK